MIRCNSVFFLHNKPGTAAVAAAGVFASLRITGKKLVDNVFLFQGAGEVSILFLQYGTATFEHREIVGKELASRDAGNIFLSVS